MLSPPHPIARRGYKHTHMDIHCGCYDLKLNFAKILMSRKQRFNKRLYYVLAVLRRQATTVFNAIGSSGIMLYHPSISQYLPRMGVVGGIYLQINYQTSLPLHTAQSFCHSRYRATSLSAGYRQVASPHDDSN